ncbi:family 43 glycosylhydrolase [Paenibacillus sp. LHD-117]|uniref:family 43 glycosylhydrolase n=1 Tax=Paenibacillus sp. LHD-117 TaxID=3071412 RepID=UPI0027E1248C|nr:family 43 glycosylhydrolase [Paenibacillus sp. LHD-117]MDQ6417903.1 family 43 glycosylhydrolase [Paenibacillus sp. LHD-117]
MTQPKKAYPIAILPGDYPDPSVVRVGDDYYMTHSSFDYMPGLLVWHSRNLTEWEPIGHAVHTDVGCIMAPDMIWHEGRFYIYFPAAQSNWVVTAESPEGPWSEPVNLHVGYIDPGHAVDEAGNRYLFLSEGYRIRLAEDGLSTTGELRKVYEGWRYPAEWRTEGFYLESPKLTYRNGYYYMTCAQGGTAGPATSHMIISARAKSIDGPWENSPYNPIVRTESRAERWWSKGHGTLVDTPEGDWYVVYHAYEKNYATLGRQTLLEPIRWEDDGWFRTADQPELPQLPPAGSIALSDDFESERLSPQWHFYDRSGLTGYGVGDGRLMLQGQSKEAIEPLLCIPYHHTYEASVTVQAEEGTEGHLSLFYKPGFQCGIGFNGTHVFSFRDQYRSEYTEAAADAVTLRIVNDCHDVDLYYRIGGSDWRKLDHGFEMSGFHNNVLGKFLSLRIALDAVGDGKASFSRFIYNGIAGSGQTEEGEV